MTAVFSDFKDVIGLLTINPISALYYGACILALWMASIGNEEYNKTALVMIIVLILLRAPIPLTYSEKKGG